ncbi:MAG TPA: hypothetical protein VG387_05410 [Rhizomicrobium sp.]|jgi:hypothetical protein|nr:hypothetical protein [Rhizomicrobium sp.]
MQYVCDAGGRRTWFRIETEAEAVAESEVMRHAVEKHFRRARESAVAAYKPAPSMSYIERDIGLGAHIQRSMPVFVTLREHDGTPLATAMLAPGGADDESFRSIVVGPANADPFGPHAEAITALGCHFGLTLTRERCYPYQNYGI